MNAPVYGKNYIDNPPIHGVTAEDVRRYKATIVCKQPGCKWCVADAATKFLPLLLKHPGVSSTARAVIEAMIGEVKP